MTATTRATDATEYTATDGTVTLVRDLPTDGAPQSAHMTVVGRGGDELHVEADGSRPGHLDFEIAEPGGRLTTIALDERAASIVVAALATDRSDAVAVASGVYRHPVSLTDHTGKAVVDITTGLDTSLVIIANHVAGVVLVPAADRQAFHDALYTVAHVAGLDLDTVGPDHCPRPVDPTDSVAPGQDLDVNGIHVRPCAHPYGAVDVCPDHGPDER